MNEFLLYKNRRLHSDSDGDGDGGGGCHRKIKTRKAAPHGAH